MTVEQINFGNFYTVEMDNGLEEYEGRKTSFQQFLLYNKFGHKTKVKNSG